MAKTSGNCYRGVQPERLARVLSRRCPRNAMAFCFKRGTETLRRSAPGMPSLEEIVFEARRLQPRERAELLDRLCGDDTALREQVMERLRESSPQWWDLEDL